MAGAKAAIISLAPDQIRELMLTFMYDHHKLARGIRAQLVGLRDLQSGLKKKHGFTQQEVASNLDYLVQKGWVKEDRRERTFSTGGTIRSAEQIKYKISDAGIDRVEGESKFKKQSPYGGINIASMSGVVQVGDHNVVNNHYLSLAKELDRLEKAVSASSMPNEDKVSVVGDIQTIEGQLAKPSPNRNILKQAWTAIQATVTAHDFAGLTLEAGRLIAPLIS